MAFKRILLVKPRGRKGLGFASDVIPIGLEYIAASLENIVDEVHIIDLELEQSSFHSFLDALNPDLVAITMSATDHYEGLHIAKIVKETGCTTVLGGYHPTAIPDELLLHPQVDLIVRDEGEYTMRELVQKDSFETRKYVRFKKPRLKISEEKGRITTWTIEGWDEENELIIVLETYAEKKFTMNGGGSQVYREYAVTPAEFRIRTKDQIVTLKELGNGVGTFEDAYGLPGF